MAGFRCAACDQEGECVYEITRHECPVCGSADVVFALPVDELPDEFVEALGPADEDDASDEG
jgi:hypothetical protein